MDKLSVEREVTDFLAKKLNIPSDKITSQSAFSHDLGISSYQVMDFICDIEEKYHCEIPDDVLRNFQNIDDLVSYIVSANNK